MLQDTGQVTGVNRGLQFYTPVSVATDHAFPFAAQDPFVLRTVRHDAVVFHPPDRDLTTLELPPIEEHVRQATAVSD